MMYLSDDLRPYLSDDVVTSFFLSFFDVNRSDWKEKVKKSAIIIKLIYKIKLIGRYYIAIYDLQYLN